MEERNEKKEDTSKEEGLNSASMKDV